MDEFSRRVLALRPSSREPLDSRETGVPGSSTDMIFSPMSLLGSDQISFTISDHEELSELDVVKNSRCQEEVRQFLHDADMKWTALAAINKQRRKEDISNSNILGVVAIKSSQKLQDPNETLKVLIHIWLHSSDTRFIRHVLLQILLQVFGNTPTAHNDVRRNHFTVEGVKRHTPVEAEIIFFTDDMQDFRATESRIDLKAPEGLARDISSSGHQHAGKIAVHIGDEILAILYRDLFHKP